MFDGLMSLWMTRAAWISSSALAMWMARVRAFLSGSGWRASKDLSDSPPKSSSTMVKLSPAESPRDRMTPAALSSWRVI